MSEQQKKEKIKYISKGLNFRIVMKSSYTKEVNGKIIAMPGNSIQFKEGVYETDDPKEIKFLDNHGDCGGYFIKVKDKDLAKARNDKFKDLDTKTAELKAKEKELERREKALEEGEGLGKKEEKTDYSKMKIEELKEIAEARDIEVGEKADKEKIIEALEKSDLSNEKEEPAF